MRWPTVAHGFQYFSLTNFGRNPTQNAVEEFANVLTEQNLRWQIPGEIPLAIAAQALIRTTGTNDDVLRIGPRCALHDTPFLKSAVSGRRLKYWLAVYGAQFDHTASYQWQLEHCFSWDVLPDVFDGRVYLAGFADHNLEHAGNRLSTWIEEAQLSVRVVGEWYIVAEQRYNGFRRGDESSLRIGLEYVVRFK